MARKTIARERARLYCDIFIRVIPRVRNVSLLDAPQTHPSDARIGEYPRLRARLSCYLIRVASD